MPDLLTLRGLRVVAAHGALPEERERPQPFEIDLHLEADLAAAGRSDALSDTINYAGVVETAVRVVEGGHVALLETLAQRIADSVLALAPRADAVTVTVRKLRPPVPFDLASAGVTITRRR